VDTETQGSAGPQDDKLRGLNIPFDEVFSAEIKDWVSKLPKYKDGVEGPKFPNHPDPRNNLVGLAMSGGGTRSATFNLGVTQALAQYGFMEHVDYMSTISGGGYLGTSFTSLCADEFDPEQIGDPPVRLGMKADNFPYSDQNPYLDSSVEGWESPIVHGLETPATRHVRENSRLIIPGLGFFNRENWVSLSRYAVSTLMLWVFFLIPMTAAILLPLLTIPETAWNRADPFSASTGDWAYSLGNQPWLAFIPLALLAVTAPLAFIPVRTKAGRRYGFGLFIELIQTIFLVVMAVSAAAVFLVFGVWAYTSLLGTGFAGWELGAVGAGTSGGALASLRMLVNMSEGFRRQIMDLVFGLLGYFVLGLSLVAGHHVLWNGWTLIHWEGFRSSLDKSYDEYWIAWAIVIGVIAISWAMADRILNFFSMNGLYEERVRRTWVISPIPNPRAGRAEKGGQQNGWKRVWERNDMKVAELIKDGQDPVTPYPLVVTTLNLSGSTSPKLLNRRADSFVIGPAYTGSPVTRWRRTSHLASFRRMPLARAAGISAAAFSPNMGRRTNTTMSIITTLFNARLGWWVRNPKEHGWFHRTFWPPSFFLYWMEMFGRASHDHPYVYLSDGGHFENMGIYELMRRRCKFIIAIDGTGEPPVDEPLAFGGLGLCLRRARIDFGVLVDMDLRPMFRDKETGQVKSYFAVGRIRYPSANGHGQPGDDDSGILVYIKAGINEKTMSADLINYHRSVNPNFPHDPTADQQFDEPQFESYRELGFLAGQAVCKETGPNDDAAKRFTALDKYYQGVVKAIGGTCLASTQNA